MVVEADGHPDACLIAALLTDGRSPTADGKTTNSDLLSLISGARALPHLRRAAESVEAAFAERQDTRTSARRPGNRRNAPIDEEVLCRAVLSGFPDRVAQRRAEHGDALLLAAGTGARLSPASGVRNAAWLVALDVRGIEGREAVVQLASGVERDWLAPTHTERRVWVDDTGRLRAARVRRYDALTLQEHPDALQAEDRAVLVRAWQDAPRSRRGATGAGATRFRGHRTSTSRTCSRRRLPTSRASTRSTSRARCPGISVSVCSPMRRRGCRCQADAPPPSSTTTAVSYALP